MIYTATIRQRGQLTIPDKMRGMLAWLNEGEVVGLEVREDEEGVLIKPKMNVRKDYDWDKIWNGIKLCRSFKSTGKDIPASQFIIEDRNRH